MAVGPQQRQYSWSYSQTDSSQINAYAARQVAAVNAQDYYIMLPAIARDRTSGFPRDDGGAWYTPMQSLS